MDTTSISTQSPHSDLDSETQEHTQREAFWQSHVKDWRASDLTQAEYARAHDLALSQFGYWKRKLSQEAVDPSSRSFIPVKLPASAPVRITTPDGLMIECSPGTDATWLKALLRVADAT